MFTSVKVKEILAARRGAGEGSGEEGARDWDKCERAGAEESECRVHELCQGFRAAVVNAISIRV